MGDLKAPPGPNSVHLCLDMQRLFAAGGPWPTPWMERVLPGIVLLAAHAPHRCIFTRFIPPVSPRRAEGMWRRYYERWREVTTECVDIALLDLVPELQRFSPPARVIDKTVYSAFFSGELHFLLRSAYIDTLVVTGSETDVCVLSTVLSAVDLGYRVIVVRDAVCSSTDEGHDALMTLYENRYDVQIELATTAEVVEGWKPVGWCG